MAHEESDFPRKVADIENVWITMPDGCRLAARLWLPEGAEQKPVPAILEYIPYRNATLCAGAMRACIRGSPAMAMQPSVSI
jgi:predicted acyl esterase